MTGREQDTTRSLALPDDMTRSRCTQYTILPNQQLLHSICSTDFGNQLHDLGVVVASISSNDQEAALNAFGNGEEDACDERLAIVKLLEDGDLLSKS